MLYTLGENLLRFTLQGPLVGVRSVWLWNGREQLMLPGNLRRRKWIIEHLSLRRHVFEDLSAAEQNTELLLQVWLAKQAALFCLVPFMQSDTTQCLFLAARGARGKSRGIRASKGLSERAPFPPGHILHYPTRWESDNLCMHTHIGTHTHAGNNAKTKEIISPQRICSVCTPPVSFSADVIMSSSALQTNTDVMIARYRQDKWTRRGVALEIGLFHFILLKFWCGAKPKYLTGKGEGEKERCDLRSLSTVINRR